MFKVGAVSGVERASVEVRSSERSCPCLKCEGSSVERASAEKSISTCSEKSSCSSHVLKRLLVGRQL